ncbi:hypothetical protein GsuE55_30330 [Geobacillus subterraneus]|uniref:Uncharacterized protein n=1 Tax=Geobacillus subterraneus TaxID=129338 RepID=A0A679FQ72_9BACL|nr:hypothetical protein GsuE55_30330 [Geobacillus subterraneus]
MTPSGGEPELDRTKSGGRPLIGETRWRACEEVMPPKQDRSVANRWRLKLDSVIRGFFRRLSSFEGMNFLVDNQNRMDIIITVENNSRIICRSAIAQR